MTDKPEVQCPSCGEIFPVEKLAARRLRRNKYGIDVFACPACSEPIKIDPYEYAAVSQMIATGEVPEGVAIGACLEGQLMGCEKKARKEMGWFSRLFGK